MEEDVERQIVCVCVCVREREREKSKTAVSPIFNNTFSEIWNSHQERRRFRQSYTRCRFLVCSERCESRGDSCDGL